MTNKIKAPVWFWVVAIMALIWNLAGVYAYLDAVTMTPEALAKLDAAQRVIIESTPAWATAAFAVAVWGGALGSLLLLLRKSMATIVLILSLVGIIFQNINAFFFTNSWEVFGPGGVGMVALVIAVAIFLIWVSRHASQKGWSN